MAYTATRSIKFNGRDYAEGDAIEFGTKDAQAKLDLLDVGAIDGDADDDPAKLLAAMTIEQLVAEARDLAIVVPDKPKKPELIKAIMARREDEGRAT